MFIFNEFTALLAGHFLNNNETISQTHYVEYLEERENGIFIFIAGNQEETHVIVFQGCTTFEELEAAVLQAINTHDCVAIGGAPMVGYQDIL